MKRPLVVATSATSLLLCVATAVLWMQSYSMADYVRLGYWHRRPHPFYGSRGYGTATDLRILHWRGRLAIGTFMSGCVDGPTFHRTGPGEHGESFVWTRLKADETDGLVSSGKERMILGVGFRFDATRWFFSIPDGATIAFFLVMTAWLRLRRSRHAILGLCPTCRYDLTANVSGICPECGTPVPKEPADKSPRSA